MAMRKGLGKGLGALIGDYSEQPDAPNEGAVTLPLQKIEPNPLQPRKTFNPEAAVKQGRAWGLRHKDSRGKAAGAPDKSPALCERSGLRAGKKAKTGRGAAPPRHDLSGAAKAICCP